MGDVVSLTQLAFGYQRTGRRQDQRNMIMLLDWCLDPEMSMEE